MLYVKFIDIMTRWEQKYHVLVLPRVGEKCDFYDRQYDYEVVDVVHYATPSQMKDPPAFLDRVIVLVKPWEPVISIRKEEPSHHLRQKVLEEIRGRDDEEDNPNDQIWPYAN